MKPRASASLLAVLLLVLPALCAAAEPGIPVDTHFRVPVMVDGKIVQARAFVTGDRTLRLFYATAAGDVDVLDYAISRKGGPEPTPPTPTPPTPTPKPQPTAVKFLYLIHESAVSSPQQAAVRQDKAWKDAAAAAGIRCLVFDVDDGKKNFPAATQRAQDKGLPALVLLDALGRATAEPAPATPEAMAARIEALVRGK